MELSKRARNWKKYRKWILIGFVIYVMAMLALIFATSGPQTEPFKYQIF